MVEIAQVPVHSELAGELLRQPPIQDELIILPRRVIDGQGEYLIEDVQAVKVLGQHGLSARLLRPRQQRTTIGEFSANEVLALSLFVAQAR